MSKAFTKEPDGDDDDRDVPDDTSSGGFTSYITPAGRGRLNEELSRLWKADRPKLVDTIAWADRDPLRRAALIPVSPRCGAGDRLPDQC